MGRYRQQPDNNNKTTKRKPALKSAVKRPSSTSNLSSHPSASEQTEVPPPRGSSVWDHILFRLRNLWTRSSSNVSSSRRSSRSAFHSVCATPVCTVKKADPAMNSERQKIMQVVKDALQFGLANGVLVRNGKFFAVNETASLHDCIVGGTDENPCMVDTPKKTGGKKPQPITVEKARTLKIDKFFNNTQPIDNNLMTKNLPNAKTMRKGRCARCSRAIVMAKQKVSEDDSDDSF